MAPHEKKHIVVLGAGVIGLTNAVFLAEAGYHVTIIAAHKPGDEDIEYTSPWAGGHWRTHATAEQPVQCDWDVQTYDYWADIITQEQRNPKLLKSGLKFYDSFHLWDTPVKEDLWWAPHVRNFQQLSNVHEPTVTINANRPNPAHDPRVLFAASCTSMSFDVPRYLAYLQFRFMRLGMILFQHRVPVDGGLSKALRDVDASIRTLCLGPVAAVVNATGLGAAELCNDTSLFPIRGQTVLVKGEAAAIRTRYTASGDLTYCIPRPGSGTTILGGTREVGEWSAEVDEQTTAQILYRCAIIAPELCTAADGGFEVLSVQCGLRPGRAAGPRVEREMVVLGDTEERVVVHSYGHGGAGYQNSIGCARAVLRLIEEGLEMKNVEARL